jgi:predicted choloylglycine hydrolase
VKLLFKAVREEMPGEKWREHTGRIWQDYERWFLQEGDKSRPGYLSCRRAIKEHMPELCEMWERLTELSGGTDRAARMLSLYQPPPFITGCSQAIWTRDQPVLIRNYDYRPSSCEALILWSNWHGTRTMVSTDCLWGVLDGINEHGLTVALAFGGRRVVGPGFGIPLILRYVLEFCQDVHQAVEALQRIPSHMSYSVGLLDGAGEHRVVYLNPDRPAKVVTATVFTNHQDQIEWPEYAERTRTQERHAYIEAHCGDAEESIGRLKRRFLEPPLHARDYDNAFGTLYTAAYRPADLSLEMLWPSQSWNQSLEHFVETTTLIQYA